MYDLRFRTDVRFREVWCKEGNFYWHSSRRQLVRVMLTPFSVLFGQVLREDGKWEGQRKIWQHPLPDGKGCLPADRPWGGGDSITSSLQSLGRVGRGFFIISSAVRVFAPFQSCLCAGFAPFPCGDLGKGHISNMANPSADTTSGVMQFSFCLVHPCYQQKLNICKSSFKIPESNPPGSHNIRRYTSSAGTDFKLSVLLFLLLKKSKYSRTDSWARRGPAKMLSKTVILPLLCSRRVRGLHSASFW